MDPEELERLRQEELLKFQQMLGIAPTESAPGAPLPEWAVTSQAPAEPAAPMSVDPSVAAPASTDALREMGFAGAAQPTPGGQGARPMRNAEGGVTSVPTETGGQPGQGYLPTEGVGGFLNALGLQDTLFPGGGGGGVDPNLLALRQGLGEAAGDTQEALRESVLAQEGAMLDAGDARAQAESQTAQALDQLITDHSVMLAQQDLERQEEQSRIQLEMSRLDQAISNLAAMRVDDTNFFSSRGALSTISAALAVGAGAMASTVLNGLAPGSNAQNLALSIIDRAIQNDLAAQEANMRNAAAGVTARQSLVQQMQQISQSQEEARQKAAAALYKKAAIEVQAIAASARAPELQAVAQQAAAELETRYQTYMAGLLQQRIAGIDQALARRRGGGTSQQQRFSRALQLYNALKPSGDSREPTAVPPGTVAMGDGAVWRTLPEGSREMVYKALAARMAIEEQHVRIQALLRNVNNLSPAQRQEIKTLVLNIQEHARDARGYGAPQQAELVRLENMFPDPAQIEWTDFVAMDSPARVAYENAVRGLFIATDSTLRSRGLLPATAQGRIQAAQSQGLDLRPDRR